jgi:hypothetical protein
MYYEKLYVTPKSSLGPNVMLNIKGKKSLIVPMKNVTWREGKKAEVIMVYPKDDGKRAFRIIVTVPNPPTDAVTSASAISGS